MVFIVQLLIYPLLLLGAGHTGATEVYVASTGVVNFSSDAPLELIRASSRNLRGALDLGKNTFAFSLPVQTFEGFNSPLQREHFNEKFMESDIYPNATFHGKIIETIDPGTKGEMMVRAKGNLTIHGVTRERIIRSKMTISEGKIVIESQFSVLLADHSITIPKIVSQKIAEEIVVTLNVEMIEKKASER
ncbi:MAG: YceI family protein [Bacteroidia bacterium]